jgi:hypothetical protein
MMERIIEYTAGRFPERLSVNSIGKDLRLFVQSPRYPDDGFFLYSVNYFITDFFPSRIISHRCAFRKQR